MFYTLTDRIFLKGFIRGNRAGVLGQKNSYKTDDCISLKMI